MHRLEHDFLGTLQVPNEAYFGINAARAADNFRASGISISTHPSLIRSLALVKQAAAMANRDLGLLERAKADAIVRACVEIVTGHLHDQFIVDVFQGGAGTSSNMNANEVIANRALEILGYAKGDYTRLSPNDDVNLNQSTNDVYPTALRVAILEEAIPLRSALQTARSELARKGEEFKQTVKVARTQLQDAVLMTLGQEFGAHATMIEAEVEALAAATEGLRTINLGGTAIGTGINAHPEYAELVCQYLSDLTGEPLSLAANLIAATQDTSGFVAFSGSMKRIAIKLSKLSSDLRLLASGPQAGFSEINLPPMQAGSSIMPGKINPVIPEMVNQIAFEIIGNDVAIALAAEAGQLQLNAFGPLIAHLLLSGLVHLGNGCRILATTCIGGITANDSRLRDLVEASQVIATALVPHLGYSTASSLSVESRKTGKSVRELVLKKGLMTSASFDLVLASFARCTLPTARSSELLVKANTEIAEKVSIGREPGREGSR